MSRLLAELVRRRLSGCDGAPQTLAPEWRHSPQAADLHEGPLSYPADSRCSLEMFISACGFVDNFRAVSPVGFPRRNQAELMNELSSKPGKPDSLRLVYLSNGGEADGMVLSHSGITNTSQHGIGDGNAVPIDEALWIGQQPAPSLLQEELFEPPGGDDHANGPEHGQIAGGGRKCHRVEAAECRSAD